LTLAERQIIEALKLLAEMPAHPLLQEAKAHLFTATDLISRFVDARDTDVDQLAPPPSTRETQATLPDGAE
jgi:hypothetical protein